MRWFCMSYCGSEPAAYERALESGRAVLGAQNGAICVAIISDFMASIRNNRSTGFNFVMPCCEICRRKVSQDENIAMWMLKAARSGEMDELERATNAMLPAEGNQPEVVKTALRLGIFLRYVDQGHCSSQEGDIAADWRDSISEPSPSKQIH
ncbi:MAG: hypothetical protein AAF141_02200 [Pseudomonadota bacterium]